MTCHLVHLVHVYDFTGAAVITINKLYNVNECTHSVEPIVYN